jgi:aerobic carbon-monoxide dehydrogenase medium subunit
MQVPAPFDYARAASVDHALELLAQYGPEARVVAGGHSLIPMMKLRLAKPEALIDINGLTHLAYIRVDGDRLGIGALTRHAQVLDSPVIGEHLPVLHDAERVIADPVVRNWGTVGGSLCQADPAEDLPAAFAAVGASAVIRGAGGTRTVPLREFHLGPYETVVGPGELLIEVSVPIRPGGSSAYEKVERRAGDWPAAAAAAAIWLTSGVAGWSIDDVGIGLTAVGAEHYSAPAAEAFLRGKLATEENLAEAGRIAAENCNPATDQRGPVEYKRHLAKELTTRALRRAVARVTGTGEREG